MCNSASCHHRTDWDAPRRTVYPGRSAADKEWVLVTHSSDLDWTGLATVATQAPDNEPAIGRPKRDKARTKMARQSKRRNRR